MLPPPPEKKEKLIPGPYVRSQKLPAVKTTLQPSVLQFLAEVGVGRSPPPLSLSPYLTPLFLKVLDR